MNNWRRRRLSPIDNARNLGTLMGPRTGIEALQGNPLDVLDPRVARLLRTPLNPAGRITPMDDGTGQSYSQQQPDQINWSSQTVGGENGNVVFPAYPNRVILIVLNLDATDNIAVNFDQDALASSTSEPQNQGIVIQPGGNLYIDRNCPTNTVHVYTPLDVFASVTQGFKMQSAQGPTPRFSFREGYTD
jgi:hypothetical protein